MTKPKTLDQLRAEKERAETQLAQEQHKLERLENRKKYLEKGERQKRTHRLCNLGGTVESLAPEVKDLTRTEMTELMEHIFSLSAERNCMTENVSSLRSVKVATPPCAAKAAIPCGLAVRKQHKMLFAASKFEKLNTEKLTVDWSHYAKS